MRARRSKLSSAACSGSGWGRRPSSRRATTWSAGRLTNSTPTSRPSRKQNTEKMAAVRVAAYHRSIVTRGDAGDLQFQIGLVAPEPRDLIVGRRLAGDARRRALRAWSTPFCTNSRRTRPSAKRVGKLAQSPIATMSRSPVGEIFINDDAIVDREPGVAGEFGVGYDPDADRTKSAGSMPAVGGLDRGDPAGGAENAVNAGAERDRRRPSRHAPR